MNIALIPTGPYDFAQALDYLRASPAAILERVGDDGVYRRAVNIAGRDVLLVLRAVGSVVQPRLTLEVLGDHLDEALMTEAARLVRHIFSLDTDPTPFYALANGDAVFGALVQRYYGLRPLLVAAAFEAAVWAIIGQQVNISFARKLKHKFIELCGRTAHIAGDDYALMPTPQVVAALDPARLTANQFSRQKASYIIGLAQAVVDGALDFAIIAQLPHEQAIGELTRLKGVGRWTAEYLLMRGFGAQDSIPAADMGLRIAMGRAYGLGRNATEQEVREIAARWAGWRGWAAFFWWHALQRSEV